MTHADYFMTALCIWREARIQGADGMIAVACVIRNRQLKRVGSTPFTEVTRPLQFSSITAPGDRQLALYPVSLDSQWADALGISQDVLDGSIKDVTGGATLYYNPDAIAAGATIGLKNGTTVPYPKSWKTTVQETVTIGTAPYRHIFFTED